MVGDELKKSVGVGSCGGVRRIKKKWAKEEEKKEGKKNEIKRLGMVTARPWHVFLAPGGPCGSRPCRL